MGLEKYPTIKEYVEDFCLRNLSMDKENNWVRRSMIKRYIRTIQGIANSICESENHSVNKKSVENWLDTTFLLSDTAKKKYVERIIAFQVFEYDPINEIFKFPALYQRIFNNEQEQKQIQDEKHSQEI